MKYVLTLNEEQEKYLETACEFYARMMNGQWNELVWRTLDIRKFPDDFCERRDKMEDHMFETRQLAFPELDLRGASYGVGKFEDSDIVWEIYEVLRNTRAWHNNPEGGGTVDFSKPMSFSGKPLAECIVEGN